MRANRAVAKLAPKLPDVPEALPAPATLQADAASMGVELTSRQAAQIIQFGELLLRWNRAFNLISRKDEDRLYHRHLLDSLSVAPWLSGPRVMDLGTGAGLPGIPLAIARQDLAFTLLDRSERRIRVVRHVVRDLGLENVEAVCGDIESRATEAVFDVVVTRAVAGLALAWGLARSSIRSGGRLLLMEHGQRDQAPERAEDLQLFAAADARIAGRQALVVPGLGYPHGLVVVEKRVDSPADSTEH